MDTDRPVRVSGGVQVCGMRNTLDRDRQWNDYQRKLVPGSDDTPEKLERIERDIRMLTNERDRLRASLRAG